MTENGNRALVVLRDAARELQAEPFHPSRELALSLVTAAERALEQAKTPKEANEVRKGLRLIEEAFSLRNAELVDSNLVVSQRLRTEWKLGTMLRKLPRSAGGRPGKNSLPEVTSYQQALDDIHASGKLAWYWERISEIDEDHREVWINEHLTDTDFELSTASLFGYWRFLNGDDPYVHISDDSYEWFTPPEYIAAAREVMGEIDLDPASSDAAQKAIKAKTYYTAQQDGLSKRWFGRVWLNPPYNMPLIDLFIDRVVTEYEGNVVSAAIVLTNNSTDTGWFHKLIKFPFCLTRGRIPFWNGDDHLATRQGQALFYLGDNPDLFAAKFKQFGAVLKEYDHQQPD